MFEDQGAAGFEAPKRPGQLKRQLSSRRAMFDAEGEEVVRPGCFTRAVMKCPCLIMWVTFTVAIILAALPFVSRGVTIKATEQAGYDTSTLPEHVAWFAWLQVEDDKFVPAEVGQQSAEASDSTGEDLPIILVYEGLNEDANMFTPDSLAAMATYETALLELDEWTTHCKNVTSSLDPTNTSCSAPQTVLRYLYRNDALEQSQCEAGFCDAPDVAFCESAGYGIFPCTSSIYDWRDGVLAEEAEWPSLLETRLCANAYLGQMTINLLPSTSECTADSLSSRYVRSIYYAYAPNGTDSFTTNEAAWVTSLNSLLETTRTEVSATDLAHSTVQSGPEAVNVWFFVWWSDYDDGLWLVDIFNAVYSMIFIFLIVFANTGSLLLTLAGMFEILISVPLAMFAWMLIGQDQLSVLELLGLFLILCIGADDIFVLTDTWKESAVMPPAISGSLQTRFTWTYNRAAGAMLTTTFTTAFCLLLNAASPFPSLRAFGLFNMFVVIADYVLVITWYACATICLSRLTSATCKPGENWEWSCCCPGGKAEKKERRVTAWFKNTLAPATHKLRWVLLVLSVCLLGGGIAACATMYEIGEVNFFGSEHPNTVGATINSDEFGSVDDWKLANTIIYGMDTGRAVDFPSSIDLFQATKDDYLDGFSPNYAPAFDFGPTQQEQMVADCKAIRANTVIVPDAESYCLLNDLQAEVGSAFPYADEAALRVALEDFYNSSRYAELTERDASYEDHTGFVAEPDGDGIRAIFHSFNDTMPGDLGFAPARIKTYYDPWKAAVDARCTEAESCLLSKTVAGPTGRSYYYWMSAMYGLADSAFRSVVIALIASYFVLVVVTKNVLVPFLAVISIGSTITWVLGGIFLLGYKFEVFAAILTVMIVGMSVDYAVHLTHFYNEAPGTRYEKAQSALHGVGFSVLGGALTTGGAAIPLCASRHFVFFQEAGYFIFFTAIAGVSFSFMLLMPLLMIFGPEGDQGDLLVIYRRLRGQKAPANKTPPAAGSTRTK